MWTPRGWYEEARRYASERKEWFRGMADLFIRNYSKWMPEMPKDKIIRQLQEWNDKRINATPDLSKYPELQGMKELIQAEWNGWKDGAELSEEQWIAYCDSQWFYHRRMKCGITPPGCSYVYFPTSDRGPLLANNLDTSPDQPFTEPEWPLINEHLIIGGVSSGIFLDEDSPEIFPAPVFKLIGRYCRNTKEAVELLQRYNYFWGPGNLIVIDRSHNVAMIEKSTCRIGVRYSNDGFGFITAMTAEESRMRAWLLNRRQESLRVRNLPIPCADTIYWDAADQRHNLMKELIERAKKNPSFEEMRKIIQFRDPERGYVCYNGEILFPPDGPPCEHTIRTVIWMLAEGKAAWWAKEGEKPSFENRKPDVIFKNVLLWK